MDVISKVEGLGEIILGMEEGYIGELGTCGRVEYRTSSAGQPSIQSMMGKTHRGTHKGGSRVDGRRSIAWTITK
jgi:hypothetical protein